MRACQRRYVPVAAEGVGTYKCQPLLSSPQILFSLYLKIHTLN